YTDRRYLRSFPTRRSSDLTTMLEAMRILKEVYPRPKRTIMIALWGGEEQGLNGSRRFAAMHPEVVEGLQALFNQDNGTGRVVNRSEEHTSELRHVKISYAV